ncbi:MAG: hypothetical protein KY467_18800 [Gemmatimonadetes bacterium]|nr:hypothetical protein [Gemmatimonadota bacterium]
MMDDNAFQELLENTRLAADWLKGKDTAARVTFVGEPDPREIRAKLGMTQEEFAAAL